MFFYTLFTYIGFVGFLRLFTMCDVDPESSMNISFIYFLTVFFLHTGASSPKNILSWTLSWTTYIFSIYISSSYFSFLRLSFLHDPSCDSTYIISSTSYWDKNLQPWDHFSCSTYSNLFCGNILESCVHISCSTYSTCFIFSTYNQCSCGYMYHTCCTFPLIEI